MALEGPLKEFHIQDVFQLLDLGRKTGVLRVTSELRQTSVGGEGHLAVMRRGHVGEAARPLEQVRADTSERLGRVARARLSCRSSSVLNSSTSGRTTPMSRT
jgi:hypothetical protein